MTSRQATSAYAKVAGRAVRQVTAAVKAGRLVRPMTCSDCGGGGSVQGHHHNGYGPGHELDVVWLCAGCHRVRHNRRASLPSWERGARAYAVATGRNHPDWRYHSFHGSSMPKHLLKTLRHLWLALRTDEEREAARALIASLDALAAQEGTAA